MSPMLTPEIKTNLILKEIGIKRYLIRSNNTTQIEKKAFYFKKGPILTLLEKPYINLAKQQQELMLSIIKSTKYDLGDELHDVIFFKNEEDLSKKINTLFQIDLVMIFGKISNNIDLDIQTIMAPSLNVLFNSQDSKKKLWIEIKNKLAL